LATPSQVAALFAAMRRVSPSLSKKELEIEVLFILATTYFPRKKPIYWRRFELGRQLFRHLAEAQNWRCCYCGIRVGEEESRQEAKGTFEHVIPLAHHGPDHPDNMVIACKDCNVRRGSSL
jgi:5-methylcytosine-specific restriction endonuclease McrA